MDNKVHVLIVADYISQNSGVSSVVMNYYTHIDHSKIQMDFLLYKEPEEDYLEYLYEKGSKVYYSGYPMEIGIGKYQKEIDSFFAEHKNEYSVVHVHIPNAAFIVLKYAKKYGVKTRIIHSHNSRGADGIVKKVRNYILNKLGIFYANQYFACSKSAGKFLFGNKYNHQITIIHNAIDLKKYSYNQENREKIRKQIGIEDECLLGHVGRFSEQKNHEFLIKIANELKRKNVPFKLILLSNGELLEKIQQQVNALNLEDCVIFTGVVSNVKEYMDAMDIFLLPSLYEGLPCVCVEAQANGLPCILSETITDEVAFTDDISFLGISDEEIWAEKIMEMIQSHQLVKQREKDGCMRMNQYSIEVQAKKLEEKYLSYGNSSDTNVNV